MGQIIVRKVDDDLLQRIKARAEANGRSMEAEVREILSEAMASPHGARRSLSSFIGSVRSNRSQAEIDAYVRGLREGWGD